MSAELEAELREVRAENDRLRAALAQSDQPCAYCSLPQDEWAKCQNGFPGCARADDAMGCPELGAAMELAAIRSDNERLGRTIEERDIEHRAQMADMAERFRAVNIAVNIERVIEQSGQDIFELVGRVSAAEAEAATLREQVEKMRGALEEISERHIPDQPAAYSGDELSWAQRQHSALRQIARAALPKEPS